MNTPSPALTWLDKSALITMGAGAAGKILLWGLGVALTGTRPDWATTILWVFAGLSFVAFDLVLGSIVVDARRYGLRWTGLLAVAGAAVTSALIALEVAGVVSWPALHAAPAATLLLYALHLMWPYPATVAAPAPATVAEPQTSAGATAAPATATAAVQVNVTTGAMGARTVPEFIAARAAELQLAPPQLAPLLETSPDTVRRALEKVAARTTDEPALIAG